MTAPPEHHDDLLATLSEVTHAVNNPLSIISGNAQLLRVLAEAEGLSDDFVQPVRDIEEASARVAALMDDLDRLKERLRREARERADG